MLAAPWRGVGAARRHPVLGVWELDLDRRVPHAMDHALLVPRDAAESATGMAYLRAHEQSMPSERYVYIFWIVLAAMGLVLGAVHMTGLMERSVLGVLWTRLRLTVVTPLVPSVSLRRLCTVHVGATIVGCIAVLPLLLLTFVGPDYLDPHAGSLTGGAHTAQWGRGSYERVMLQRPTTGLPYKTFWTLGNRFGDFCNALTPLVILFALKQAPFALMALPVFGRYSMDALSMMHYWGGRLLWVYASVHTVLWAVQVADDKQAEPRMWTIVLQITRFRWAITAYIFLTLLVILSIEPIRRRYYEFFYITHIVCVIGFMVATWAHHPQIGWWMLAGFMLWGLERAVRLAHVLYLNYSERPAFLREGYQPPDDDDFVSLGASKVDLLASQSQLNLASMSQTDLPHSGAPISDAASIEALRQVPRAPPVPMPFRPVVSKDLRMQLYPGFAFVQPLAGRMLRLVLRTSAPLRWRPGQWVYLQLPALSWVQSHPFTIASAYSQGKNNRFMPMDLDAEQDPDQAQLILLLIRTRNGLTRRLWEYVQERCDAQAAAAAAAPPHGRPFNMFPLLGGGAVTSQVQGVYLRAIVDGAFGSTARVDWGAYSNAVIVCGGSGVSFGIAILDYLCRHIARALDGEEVHGSYHRRFAMRRVRFVWVMREYAHVQWAASAVRLCLELLPPEHLRVEMYVTRINDKPLAARRPGEPEAVAKTVAADASLGALGIDAAELTQFGPDENVELNLVDRTIDKHVREQGELRRARTRRARSMRRPHDTHAEAAVGAAAHADALAEEMLRGGSSAALHDEAGPSFAVPMAHQHDASIELDTLGEKNSLVSSDDGWSGPLHEPGPTDAALAPTAVREAPPDDPLRVVRDAPTYANLDMHELSDFGIVAELTRAGYPQLDEIFAEETEHAAGRTLAVGCGPKGLLALLRAVVAKRIHVRRALHGDTRGHICVYTESYET